MGLLLYPRATFPAFLGITHPPVKRCLGPFSGMAELGSENDDRCLGAKSDSFEAVA